MAVLARASLYDLKERNAVDLLMDLAEVDRVVRRCLVRLKPADLLQDDVAWRLWVQNYKCLEALFPDGKRRELRLYRAAASRAEHRLLSHAALCLPTPLTFPDGRVVLPNNFDVRKARIDPAAQFNWAALGIVASQVTPTVIAVRNWWAVVFVLALRPRQPLCHICGGKLDPTPKVRRPRRTKCRKCENRAFQQGATKNPSRLAKLRQAWRDSKRRTRAAKRNSTGP